MAPASSSRLEIEKGESMKTTSISVIQWQFSHDDDDYNNKLTIVIIIIPPWTTTLAWWGGLRTSMNTRAMLAGATAPGRITQASKVEG